jgi:hypothetical protein
MGQTLSGQYLVNHTKKEIIRQDDFLDENIYKIIKTINQKMGWMLDDHVEFVNIDNDNTNIEFLEKLIVLDNYAADRKTFPAEWFSKNND